MLHYNLVMNDHIALQETSLSFLSCIYLQKGKKEFLLEQLNLALFI